MTIDNSDIPIVILAGGKGTRMGGVDKCSLQIDHSTILSRLITILQGQSKHLYLNVSGDNERFSPYHLPIIRDRFEPSIGPLGGLYSALVYMEKHHSTSWLLTVPCDCPFLPENLLSALLSNSIESYEVVFCHSDNRDHFVISLWSSRILLKLKKYIHQGKKSVGGFIQQLQHQRIGFPHIPVDPFFNINTEQQLLQAQRMVKADLDEKN